MFDNVQIKKMKQKEAIEIADSWKYPKPYDFYDMAADKENYDEIIDPSARGDNFFSITNNQEVMGFFYIFPKESSTDEIELGIGVKPKFTGIGLGEKFVRHIIDYLDKNHSYKVIWLSVANFNRRAVKVYKRMGFKYVTEKVRKANGGEYIFIIMNNDR